MSKQISDPGGWGWKEVVVTLISIAIVVALIVGIVRLARYAFDWAMGL